jgi:diguanylate cyclase (GGDEF)-like protein/PAS domain S-box-containing protein
VTAHPQGSADVERDVHRPLTRRYLLALVLIALLSVGAHAALQHLITSQRGAAAEVNLSGRQRMLSQRIALHVTQLAGSPDPAERARLRAALTDLVAEMERAHEALRSGDPRAGLSGPPPTAVQAMDGSGVRLDERVRSFLADARAVVAVPDADLSAGHERAAAVVDQARGELLAVLDRAVLTYQRASEERVAGLRRVAQGVLLATLTALVLEGLLVFRPMVARVRRRTEAALEATAWLRSVVDNVLVGVVTVDGAGIVTTCNRTAARMFGYGDGDATGMPVTDLAEPGDAAHQLHALWSAVALGGRRDSLTFTARRRDGLVFEAEVAASLAGTPDPTVTVLVTDVTERRAFERQLSHQAFHDPLTGLPNRALFLNRLEHALRRRDRRGPVAVLFLDLDDFKTVNDALGHAAGDRLLVTVAERLDGALRGGDTAARLGGDEFAVLLEDIDGQEQTAAAAARILAALRAPVALPGLDLSISASIGVAVAPATGTVTADMLLRDADVAMYSAKARGKGRTELFVPTMHDDAVRRLRLRADLAVAHQRGELRLVHQPVVDLDSGAIRGAEALLRWRHPELGELSPAEFVPLAEQTGLIVPIGSWVLAEACRFAARWGAATAGGPPPFVSVNVSPVQLRDPAFPQEVAATLRATGLPPGRLLLELTEGVLLQDGGAERLADLAALGVRLAVDDFGTGYSSLASLRRFPVAVLKVDRSLVAAGDGALVAGVLSLAHALGVEAVVEGLETGEQLGCVRAAGYRLGQGFILHRPLEAEDFLPALRASVRRQPLAVEG